MKLMIASDIHGSAFYCEQMIEAYKREGADKLLLLGDILYHGPRNDLPEGYAPKTVIAMLNPMKKELLMQKIIFCQLLSLPINCILTFYSDNLIQKYWTEVLKFPQFFL